MVPPVDPALVDFAVEITKEAGDFTFEMFRAAELAVERKGDGSPVTEADRGAERLLRERIAARFPDDEILGEEEPAKPGTSGRRWVIDPIDGTESFTRGVALYTNLLYLEDEHGPAVGVINVPAIGEMVAAGRGLGCTFNGTPCHVNDHATIDGAMMSASGFDWWDADLMERARSSDVGLRTWGDGYGYLLVATGRIEAMVDPAVNFWDIAPCQVVIDEAGGRWSSFDGRPDADWRGTFVATNAVLHDDVVKLLGVAMTVDLVATLRTDADILVPLADGDLTAPVPTCPGWTLRDLLVHLGRVHRWAVRAVDAPPEGAWPPFGARPADDEPIGPWLRAGLDQLDTIFAAGDLERPTWGFAGPATLGWWLRRQALETTMHRWDAEIAAGTTPSAIDAATAAAGVDEWCELEAARWFRPSHEITTTVHLHATDPADGDLAGEWFLEADGEGFRWTHGHHKGDVAVRASRSDLFLVIWRRLEPGAVDVIGDAARLDEFLLASAVD